ncbi:hypothetical protein [Pseudomonas sp. NPDC088444]|uniref:hypothetical protein n=1 Tax=Pseudomonas sp. NPDC088444 TaxID=3364456 RepID=UPI00384E72AA
MAITGRSDFTNSFEAIEDVGRVAGDESISTFFSDALRRSDGLAMYASVASWLVTAAYGGLGNGDVFLLIIPFIFGNVSVLFYAVSSSLARRGWPGALVIALLNAILWHGYPF